MEHIKLFESFSEINAICRKYDIQNYTINSEGLVNVDGHVDLTCKKLTILPLKFGHVTGDFDCGDNQLISLDGSPREVGGDFFCYNNRLTSLLGGPQEVGDNFSCRDNQITSLEGAPREISGRFFCGDNPINEIYRLFGSQEDFFSSMDYNYLRGTNIIKTRFEEMCQEYGIQVPRKVEGYNYI